MGLILGIDVGSVAVKLVALSEKGPEEWAEERTRPDMARQCSALLERFPPESHVCATGYGRSLVEEADFRVNEIMANAFGARWLAEHWDSLERLFGDPPVPGRAPGPFRTIVDVGGQDSKVITFGPEGLVRDFAMNDRCAAGTGRFLEVMAARLEVDLEELDRLALRAESPAHISSACTVFAESEVVSLLSEGLPPEQVAAGVFRSVAEQVAPLAERCSWQPPVLFDGGTSRSRALAEALGRRLGASVAVPPGGQFATALGAALAGRHGDADRLTPPSPPVS